ncbi:hypothetical protein [Streptomyces sp. NPDC003077]|uniref:MinD/ParA family ATP-binding protein n=1 Tax=Streptomyces sp. NPDC003077 TaxID=3154443 RepID=UPI0033BAE1FB
MTRALVAIGSAKGSPGATTLALLLAACWPTSARQPRPLVVEADPSGGDVAARFEISDSPGLVDLAAAGRRAASARVLGECTQTLPGDTYVVAGPAGARQATAAVRLFGDGGAGLLRAGMGTAGDVLLDVGRFQPDTADLVKAADRLLLVTRGEVDALAHAAAQAVDLRSCACEAELTLIGPSLYSASEIREVLGLRRVHRVPWDAKTVRAMAGRSWVAPRRWRGVPPLVRAVTALARDLAAEGAEYRNSPVEDACSSVGRRPAAERVAVEVVAGGEPS